MTHDIDFTGRTAACPSDCSTGPEYAARFDKEFGRQFGPTRRRTEPWIRPAAPAQAASTDTELDATLPPVTQPAGATVTPESLHRAAQEQHRADVRRIGQIWDGILIALALAALIGGAVLGQVT